MYTNHQMRLAMDNTHLYVDLNVSVVFLILHVDRSMATQAMKPTIKEVEREETRISVFELITPE